MQCDFEKQKCNWTGVDKWKWVKPDYNQIKLDGPLDDPHGKYEVKCIVQIFYVPLWGGDVGPLG